MPTTKAIERLEDLLPDERNANRGTKRGRDLLEKSLRRLGAGRSIVVDREGRVVAGNKTLEVAAELGLPIRVVETTGKELVVVQRTDLSLEDKRGKELALADNRTAEVGLDWDADAISSYLDDEVAVGEYFLPDEIDAILDRLPDYEPEGGEDQPRLDRRKPVTCPECGNEFVPGA